MSDFGKARYSAGWLLKTVYIFIGYSLAVVSASFVTVVVLFIVSVTDDGFFSGSEFFQILFLGIIYTGMTAWPGYLVTILIALSGRIGFTQWMFALAGFLTAIQAVWLFEIIFGEGRGLFEGALYISILIGGAAGGFCYGLVHPKMHPARDGAGG